MDEPHFPDELRKQIEQTQAYLWRCHQDRAAMQYRSARSILWTRMLSDARAGTLAIDWRNHLTVDTKGRAEIRQAILGDYAEAVIPAGPQADTDVLVAHEMATMPTRPWEPYAAGGDWRAALDAWYADTIALDEYRKQSVNPPNATALNKIHGKTEAMLRDLSEASYRAGLAAGGETNDWQVWLNSRMQARQAPRTRPSDPEALRHHLEQLPDYWTQPKPRP